MQEGIAQSTSPALLKVVYQFEVTSRGIASSVVVTAALGVDTLQMLLGIISDSCDPNPPCPGRQPLFDTDTKV